MTQDKIGIERSDIRAALEAHWTASDANDFDVEHDIYRDDAVLDYPQSGERLRGRHNIQASRVAQPSAKRFEVRRIIGRGDLWVTEFILTYDGQPMSKRPAILKASTIDKMLAASRCVKWRSRLNRSFRFCCVPLIAATEHILPRVSR